MKKTVYYRDTPVGGGNRITLQSMTNTDTSDHHSTASQILELEAVGCEIVRVSVPDQGSVAAIERIRDSITIPLVADIHFNYKLALDVLDTRIDAVRLNPGNFPERYLEQVVLKAREKGIPIRIGVNSGSIEKNIEKKMGNTPEALVESACLYIRKFESIGFNRIVVSVKSSNVLDTVAAYRLAHEKIDYPLHIGVTEAGTYIGGSVKSSVALGILLAEGIGDTMRVSLSAPPVEEIKVGRYILKCLGIRTGGIDIISCPTCARTCMDVISLSSRIEREFGSVEDDLSVAVMGCVVNGPGEARHADIGIAGNPDGSGTLFKRGKIICRIENPVEMFPGILKEFIENLKTV